MHFIFYYFSNKMYQKPTKVTTLKLVVVCEEAGKQVRFRPAEALKFDSVQLFRKTTINPNRIPQPKIRLLILFRVAFCGKYFVKTWISRKFV